MRLKKLVVLFLAAATITNLTACSGGSATQGTSAEGTNTEAATTEASTGGGAVDLTQKEAPILAEQVAAGELPPVEERLPISEDIMVEPDVMELGAYGGSVNVVLNDSARWKWGPYVEQSLFRFKQDGSGEVEPNIAKDVYSNEDSTVWTVELREGMKWSDGEPFTADDIVFYYDHMSTPALDENRVALSSEDPNFHNAYTSKPYNCYQTIGEDGKGYWAEVTKVDDTTVTYTFAHTKPAFPTEVAVDNKWGVLPKHFYAPFVARKDGVADDATFPLITEEEALANANTAFGKNWEAYGTMSKDIGYYNWDYHIVPQLRSFIAVADNHDKVGETYTLVRNPYFFKTDSEGRQLPYLDEINVKIINEEEQVTLESMSGNVDWILIDPLKDDFPAIAEAVQDTHTLYSYSDAKWGTPELHLNQTVKDEDKRALFQDIRFREALSIMVDRELLNETAFNGMSTPAQSSVPVGLVGNDPEWTAKWTEYDPDRANALLDEITEPWDGAEGTFRKMKGTDKDVEIIITRVDAQTNSVPFELLKSSGAAVGIKILDTIDTDMAAKILANEVEAELHGGVSLSTPAIRPDFIVPMRNYMAWYSGYGKWYEDGKSTANGGVEPPQEILELIEAYEAIKAATGAERDAIVAENVQKIYDLHKENMWIIGYVESIGTRYFANNNLMNIPEGVVFVDEFRTNNMIRFEQVWWNNQ